LEIKPKDGEAMQSELPLQIYNIGNKEEQRWVYPPKDMVICIDPKRYYIRIKKYKEVWRQDPPLKVLLGNQL
jgi:hypothetical protein